MKIFQGGSTGLVQQKTKAYSLKIKPGEYKLPFLKDQMKKIHKVDVVLMMDHIGYSSVEEDAELIHKVFKYEIHDANGRRPYLMTTAPHNFINHLSKTLEEKDIKYVMLKIVSKDPIIREIVKSSDTKLIGLQYSTV
tara:strand:- start:132 stop:542 length:411 start_codon:yes stop_codon:yes gene_type:complete